ncbi:DUF523 domain-containing protein [Thalassotalea sp. ND16A]|uniref:DUF523 domain-containing protein n=1 Tax=Thalassotalea sp. ND16A TaxID=1535422 RepID=UPI00051A4902|nr:DUF523 domain-containing protein [Thalassotalea sp. ND16A]KGJ88093.1 hypothetical protein ND16A_2646 [Thalassotalea sp. ND16A]
MQKILISSCFLGNKVRFDGKTKTLIDPQIATWQLQGRLVVICPETTGGLPVPRPRAEQLADKVFDEFGNNVTEPFQQGAEAALNLCQQHHIGYALLKEYSPSCGSRAVYDGHFQGNKIPGMGVTAKLLTANGVKVYSELTLAELILDIANKET